MYRKYSALVWYATRVACQIAPAAKACVRAVAVRKRKTARRAGTGQRARSVGAGAGARRLPGLPSHQASSTATAGGMQATSHPHHAASAAWAATAGAEPAAPRFNAMGGGRKARESTW